MGDDKDRAQHGNHNLDPPLVDPPGDKKAPQRAILVPSAEVIGGSQIRWSEEHSPCRIRLEGAKA